MGYKYFVIFQYSMIYHNYNKTIAYFAWLI